ncbi:MAG: FeoB-associated Cys-rich membrane protein [Clostridia bacterium]|nr:FeoB-associated Cys-rich membrane protein [Clostridia bacterium]
MNGWEIAVLVIVCAAFAAAVGFMIYRKIKHKGGCCDCGCDGCTGCSKCKSDDKK